LLVNPDNYKPAATQITNPALDRRVLAWTMDSSGVQKPASPTVITEPSAAASPHPVLQLQRQDPTERGPLPIVLPLTSADVAQVTVQGSVQPLATSTTDGSPLYDVQLFLQAPPEVLDCIQEVKYVFPTVAPPDLPFIPRTKIGRSRKDGFPINYKSVKCVYTVTPVILPNIGSISRDTLPDFNLCSIWPR
jgi:hypothetical protein